MYRVILITVNPGVIDKWAFVNPWRTFFDRSFVGTDIGVVALDTSIAW
jgi:hypothetical protein